MVGVHIKAWDMFLSMKGSSESKGRSETPDSEFHCPKGLCTSSIVQVLCVGESNRASRFCPLEQILLLSPVRTLSAAGGSACKACPSGSYDSSEGTN